MRRTIKFRVYLKGHWAEKEYGTMLYDYQDTILSESEGWLETDDFKTMQYTGLLDKNGKEIYEGDIVKWDKDKHSNACGGKELKDYIVPIEWGDTGWLPFIESRGYGGIEMFNYDDCEVIGNIYENPGLLK